LDQTELVVLSACETGLGELEAGEGVYGLQRSFLVAGAQAVIMSLFKVSDEVTQQLMVRFYQKWLETGDKRQAFIDAKKEIRNEYPDPIYWGPFVMIGSN
jgi:CHAT domain-containing protein